ncbi:hypothetical protein D3C74_330230 [compost metagenome]
MPRLLINMYSGMIPPVKYKVNIKRNVSVVRPFNCLRDSGYAAQIVMIMPSTVNRIVTTTDTYKERRILASAKILLYAPKVNPSGHRNTLFAMTNASSLNDLAMT